MTNAGVYTRKAAKLLGHLRSISDKVPFKNILEATVHNKRGRGQQEVTGIAPMQN